MSDFLRKVTQTVGISLMVSGFLFLGVASLSSNARVQPWQCLIILTALLTSGTGILLLFFPDYTINTRFLTEDEKLAVVRRISGNQNGIGNKIRKRNKLVEALLDAKHGCFSCSMPSCERVHENISGASLKSLPVQHLSGGISFEHTRVIQSFGFTTLEITYPDQD